MARILLIDDDDSVRIMLRATLSGMGHKVFEARNGRDGLELFPHTEADLVITDIVMPEKDGMEILMEFRQRYPATRVIAMSGGGLIKTAVYFDLAKSLGAVRVLEKPFSDEALTAAIREALRSGGVPTPK